MERPKKKKLLRSILGVLVTLVLSWLLLRQVDAASVWLALRSAPLVPHVLAITALSLAATIARAHRWQWLLADAGVQLSFRDVALVRLGTMPASFALPFKGGDVVRCACLTRLGVPVATTMGTVVAEKVLVLAGAVVMALAALALSSRAAAPAGLIGCALVLLGVVAAPTRAVHRLAVAVVSRVLSAAIAERFLALLAIPLRRRAALLGYSLLLRAAELAMLVIALHAVGARLEPRATMLAGSLVGMSSLLPFTIAGLGVREGTLVVVFAGAAADDALLAAGLLFFALSQVVPAIAGLPFVLPLSERMARAPEPEPVIPS